MRIALMKAMGIAALFVAGMANPALAAEGDRLAGDQLRGYLTGNTVYVDILPGDLFGKGGLSPFYYGHDGRFAAKLSTGKITGSWKISKDSNASYCVDVIASGTTFCTDVIRKDASIEHHSVGLKRLMGTVVKIVPGNAAKL